MIDTTAGIAEIDMIAETDMTIEIDMTAETAETDMIERIEAMTEKEEDMIQKREEHLLQDMKLMIPEIRGERMTRMLSWILL